MKINMEVQHMCIPKEQMRGIPYTIKNMLLSLTERNKHSYSCSFFDLRAERHNREMLLENLGSLRNHVIINECNHISYKSIITKIDDKTEFSKEDGFYDEYFGDRADVYHFPHILWVSQNVRGKIVVTCHDIMPVLYDYRYYWEESVSNAFDANFFYIKENKDIVITADSISTKKDIIEHYNIEPERIVYVPCGYDKEVYWKDKNNDGIKKWVNNEKYLLYLGALDYRKGIQEIIEAFDKVCERRKDLKLVLAGRTSARYRDVLKRALSEAKNTKKICITGFVTDEEKRKLLSGASAFLFPSEYEGFGLPALEAMACECPVITTNVSSIPEVCEKAALYTPVKDSFVLAENILYLLDHENICEKMILQGKKQCQKFSWEQTALLLEKIYES